MDLTADALEELQQRRPGLAGELGAHPRVRVDRVEDVPGLTLIGDAAHLTPPDGEGANLAMLDGAELGLTLAAHPGDVEAALDQYEQAMFPRSAAAATEGGAMYEMLADEGAAQKLIDIVTGVE